MAITLELVKEKISPYVLRLTRDLLESSVVPVTGRELVIYTSPDLMPLIMEAIETFPQGTVTSELVRYHVSTITDIYEDGEKSGVYVSSRAYQNYVDKSNRDPHEGHSSNARLLTVFKDVETLTGRILDNATYFVKYRDFLNELTRESINRSTCLLVNTDVKEGPRKLNSYKVDHPNPVTAEVRRISNPMFPVLDLNNSTVEELYAHSQDVIRYTNELNNFLAHKTAQLGRAFPEEGGDIYRYLSESTMLGRYIRTELILEDRGCVIATIDVNHIVFQSVRRSWGFTSILPVPFGTGETWYPDLLKQIVNNLPQSMFPSPLVDQL